MASPAGARRRVVRSVAGVGQVEAPASALSVIGAFLCSYLAPGG
jgi:hypothetical protein